ncbi:MAG: hypothetical protein CMO44_11485 [Verrucomicrobiales bacterium]|nr:hypothetical protein [Verrucomicrobiales bacterium]
MSVNNKLEDKVNELEKYLKKLSELQAPPVYDGTCKIKTMTWEFKVDGKSFRNTIGPVVPYNAGYKFHYKEKYYQGGESLWRSIIEGVFESHLGKKRKVEGKYQVIDRWCIGGKVVLRKFILGEEIFDDKMAWIGQKDGRLEKKENGSWVSVHKNNEGKAWKKVEKWPKKRGGSKQGEKRKRVAPRTKEKQKGVFL